MGLAQLPFRLSDQLSLASVAVALAGLLATIVFTATQIRRSEKTSRGQFLLSLQAMLNPLAETERRLRPAAAGEPWPATVEDWREIEAFMAFFEYCAVLIRNGSLRFRDFRGFFAARLENCLRRPDIVFAKLEVEAAHWQDLLWLIRRIGFSERLAASVELFRAYHLAPSQGRPWLDVMSRLSPADLIQCRERVEVLVAYAAASSMREAALGPKLQGLIEKAEPKAANLADRALVLRRWSDRDAQARFGVLRETHAAVLLANWIIPAQPLSIEARAILARLVANAGHGALLAAWVKHAAAGAENASAAAAKSIGRAIFGGSLLPQAPMPRRAPRRRSQLSDVRELVNKAILNLRDGGSSQEQLQVATVMALTEIAVHLAADPSEDPEVGEGQIIYAHKLLR